MSHPRALLQEGPLQRPAPWGEGEQPGAVSSKCRLLGFLLGTFRHKAGGTLVFHPPCRLR